MAYFSQYYNHLKINHVFLSLLSKFSTAFGNTPFFYSWYPIQVNSHNTDELDNLAE